MERGMNCDKRQQLYRCFVKMGSKGTPIVKNPRPKDVALICPLNEAILVGGGFEFSRLNVK